MPKHPLISIPLDIPDVRVLQTELTKDGELILTVESTLTSTTCRRCGRTISQRHGVDEPRLLRHLPILGRVVYLRWVARSIDWDALEPFTTLGIDEIALLKGHRYLVLHIRTGIRTENDSEWPGDIIHIPGVSTYD